MGCVGLSGFIYFFLSSRTLGCSPVLRGLGAMPGRGRGTGQGGGDAARAVGSLLPGSLENCISCTDDSGQPSQSIFSGGVVSRWRGMLPARLLPAAFPP